MKLKLEKREKTTKGELARIRREGNIPAVFYVKNKESLAVTIKGDEFKTYLRQITPGCLATQIFDLEIDSKKCRAIVKDIQYERTTYRIEHIDLMELKDKERVSLYVPVICKGEDRCVGVSLGGQLKRVKRAVKVSVESQEIPEAFVLDVSKLGLGEALRVKDLPLTSTMKVALQPNQGIVTVNK
ncbi:MAG: 50S ribosomal protein L25 [Verrucomicrobia bacterium]|nr:50S ribosomal protein L25 [Verrucomicrobiota bacterium]